MDVIRTEQREAFETREGSMLRETAGPAPGNARNQSPAEATVAPDTETIEHYHHASEEIYRFIGGAGRMRLGEEEAEVRAGDTVVIPPGTRHKLWNAGGEPLVVLCCSSPPYSHDDTFLCE